MKITNSRYVKTVLSIGFIMLFLSISADARPPTDSIQGGRNFNTTSSTFNLRLGGTRVIYSLDSVGESLVVSNDQQYPILVQSEVLSEDRKTKAPFVITPPLFRLDGKQSSRIRIIRTGGSYPEDRESLQWVCVKGLPPENDDLNGKEKNKGVDLQVKLAVTSCIKLFVRPSTLKGRVDDVVSNVTWSKIGKSLRGTNPSPFYINILELKVGSSKVKQMHHIPPFSSYDFELPEDKSRIIRWKAITDYGSATEQFEYKLK